MFTKNDLKPGMLCEIRDGRLCLVLPRKSGDLVLWASGEERCQTSASSMTNSMENVLDYHEYDVMKVYGGFTGGNPFNPERYTLLWERAAELKRCPFCGKTEFLEIDDTSDDEDAVEVQYCVVCDATRGGCGGQCGYCDSEQEAIELWNRRAK